MIYKVENSVIENKNINYYPVLVIKFNQYKCVYYIKRDLLYFVYYYFFTQTAETDNVLCATSEGEALALLKEFKSDSNSESLINTFVKAVKSYHSPSPSPNAPQYIEHYFSIACEERVITTTLMDI